MTGAGLLGWALGPLLRTGRIFGVEARKLLSRKIGYIALLLGLLAAGLTVALEAGGIERDIVAMQGEQAAKAVNGFFVFAKALQNGVLAGGLPLLILAGLLLVEEYEFGTAKIVFAKPIRRAEVAAAKGLLLILLAAALLLAVTLFAGGLVHATVGFRDITDPVYESYVFHSMGPEPGQHDRGIPYYLPKTVAATVGLTLPPLVAILLLALFLSTLAGQSGIAVGMSFGVVLSMFAVGTLIDAAAPYLVSSWLIYPTAKLKDIASGISTWGYFNPKSAPEITRALVVPAATGLGVWLLAALVTSLRQVLAIAALALPAALLAAGEARADEPRFRITQHRVDGQVWGMRITDIDADGRSDMVVFVTQGARGPDPRRFLALFYQTEEGGFARSPDQVLAVPGDAVAQIVADLVPGAPGLEIGFVTPGGIVCHAAEDRVYARSRTPLIEERSLYDLAGGSDLPSWDSGVEDVDGDGRADVLVLRKGDAVLYLQRDKGRYEKAATFPLEYRQRFGPRVESLLLRRFLSFRAELGRPVLADVDGDGRPDLVAMRDKALEVYLQRRPGVFDADPSRTVPLGALVEEGEEDGVNRLNIDLVDIDEDGDADLLLFRNLGKVGVFESLRTQVLLFMAEPSWDIRRPTQIINLSGISMSPQLIDVDADGDRDLVVSSLRTDLISNVGTALFEAVTVTYQVFRYHREEGRFSVTADFSRDLEIDVARVEGGGTIPLAYFWGDYTGDGLKDMLTLNRQDLLTIFPAELDDGELDFSEERRAEVRLETSNSNKIQDINWDGRHDVVFWYWDANWEKVERGVITVVMSR